MKELFGLEHKQVIAGISIISGLSAAAFVGISYADRIVNHFDPSPEDILANATRAYASAHVPTEQCYPAVMESGGVLGDLIEEIQQNDSLDIDKLYGASDAARDIGNVLRAQHKLSDSDHHDAVQIGDRYGYCVLDDGEIILGDPSTYTIVAR